MLDLRICSYPACNCIILPGIINNHHPFLPPPTLPSTLISLQSPINHLDQSNFLKATGQVFFDSDPRQITSYHCAKITTTATTAAILHVTATPGRQSAERTVGQTYHNYCKKQSRTTKYCIFMSCHRTSSARPFESPAMGPSWMRIYPLLAAVVSMMLDVAQFWQTVCARHIL